mmetsp:Transcript_31729/g.52993  ORF Transcript_31729/g.52993 Transcript_31729/m.52993 type:complete len:98 (-) Transcript_31729:30-323(-)
MVCFPQGSTANPLQFAERVGLISSIGTTRLWSTVDDERLRCDDRVCEEDDLRISCTCELPKERRTRICLESEDDKKHKSDTEPSGTPAVIEDVDSSH